MRADRTGVIDLPGKGAQDERGALAVAAGKEGTESPIYVDRARLRYPSALRRGEPKAARAFASRKSGR